MRGFPKHLNTKEDYEYIRQHFPKDLWKREYQSLLDTHYGWFFDRVLEKDEEGLTDGTHKVETAQLEMEGHDTIHYQYVFRANPESKLLKIGYSEDEVKAILTE